MPANGPGSIGRALTSNLLADFEGDVVPVNPNCDSVLGVGCFPRVTEAGVLDVVVVSG